MYVRILTDFLFFFFSLFVFSSTFSIALAQVSLGVSLTLFLLIFILKKENPFKGSLKKIYIAIGLYVLWMIISALFSRTPIESLFTIKEEWLFFAIPIGIYLLKIESFRNKIFLAFAIGVCIVSVYGIIQHITGVYWFKKTPPIKAFDFGYIVKGFFPHRLTFGNFFATASMFLLGYLVIDWKNQNLKKRVFYFGTVILAIAVTLFSYSYGPILALLVTSIVLGIIVYRKYTIYILILISVIIGLAIFSNHSLKERISTRIEKESSQTNEASRLYIWSNALQMTKEHPIVGVGQGNFYSEFEKNMPGHRIHVHAHNDFFNIVAVAGIPGFIFFSFMWFIVLSQIYKNMLQNEQVFPYKKYMLAGFLGGIAFLVTSLTEATFADEEVRQMLMFVWAFGLFPIVLLEKKNGNKSILNL